MEFGSFEDRRFKEWTGYVVEIFICKIYLTYSLNFIHSGYLDPKIRPKILF